MGNWEMEWVASMLPTTSEHRDNQDRLSLGFAGQKLCTSHSQNVTLEVREVCRNMWYTKGSFFVTY
jgi:hypothetical protein